jgi:endonuclease-3
MSSVMERIERIIALFPENRWYRALTPFERLVSTILSQNTSREATILGFENLRRRFQVSPQVLAEADLEEIKECIRPAGLYNTKAPRIKELARVIVDEYGGDVDEFSRMPTDMAREHLMKIPGIGYKTADVFLSIVAGGENFAVDTHIARIARRWKLVGGNDGYEKTRSAYEAVIPPERRRRAHIALIDFGREICRARAPRCADCPVFGECEWEGKGVFVLKLSLIRTNTHEVH